MSAVAVTVELDSTSKVNLYHKLKNNYVARSLYNKLKSTNHKYYIAIVILCWITILLAPSYIYSFTRQMLPLLYQVLLTWGYS